MNKFELSSAFFIGHEKIDSDHAGMVEILNEMVDGFMLGDMNICRKKWRQFCARLEQHFIDETRIMADFGFTHEDHEEDHQKILNRVNDMGNAYNSLDDWEVCLFDMRNDLLSRILKYDLLFAEHLITIGYNEA